MDEDRWLETAIRAAREGGQLALEGLGQPGSIVWKGSRDVVTASMLAVQKRIVEIIRQEFPDHAILSEELDEKPASDAEFLWIIDPIDGSLNYIKGIPFFAVAIGLRQKRIYRLGVVYDPCRDELFHAVYRRGAYLNGRRIKTQAHFEGLEAYQAATVANDWPAQVDKRTANAMIIRLMAGEVVSLQILGSPALALCYIAAGRLDAYFHLQLQLWDVAAAAVVLQEGGGTFTDAEGSTWFYSEGGYLATNGAIHGWMLHPIRLVREQGEALSKRKATAS
jgi:myo-inositol-1(or 4)-monophosphatase